MSALPKRNGEGGYSIRLLIPLQAPGQNVRAPRTKWGMSALPERNGEGGYSIRQVPPPSGRTDMPPRLFSISLYVFI